MDITLTSDLITILLNRLGRRNDATLRASAVDEINMAQKQLESGRFLPWFLLKSMPAGVVTAIGDVDIDLPDDFIREEEDSQVKLKDPTNNENLLKKATEDVLQHKYQNASNARPKYYAIVNRTMYFWPRPDAVYVVHYWYYASQPQIIDVATTATNPWLVYAPDWILSQAGFQLASFHIQKPDMALRFRQAAAEARDNIMTMHEARIHTNMNYSDDEEYQTA